MKYKPTVANITDMIAKCESAYSELYANFDLDEKYYELEFQSELELPEEFKSDGTVLPSGRDFVDTFTDNINISNARVSVSKKGETKKDIEEAEMLRKMGVGIIYMTNTNNPISPWRIGAKHYPLYGMTVFKDVWDADRWMDKPEMEKLETEDDYAVKMDKWRSESHESLPIIISAINPRNIMIDPDFIEPQFVIENHQKICLNMKKKYPHWSNPKGKEVSGNVKYQEYWDTTYRCVLIDGEPVLETKDGIVKHNYGFLPYVPIDAGLGNYDAEGHLDKRYVGILRKMMGVLRADSRAFSMSDIILKMGAWPWAFLEGDNAKLVTDLHPTYGSFTPLPPGVKLTKVTPDVPPDAIRMHHLLINDIMAGHAAPRSVRGLSEEGVRSAADRRMMISQGAARYGYSEDSFKYGTAKVLSNCARLFKNVIPGNVRVWARTPTDEFDIEIDKDKLHEPFNFYVEFAPVSEEDEYRRHDDLERLLSSGLVTKRWARGQMSNVDVLSMERDEMREKLMNDPAILSLVSQYTAIRLNQAIQKRGLAEDIKTILPQAPQPAMPGTPPEIPGRMTTSVPNVAMPGSAEAYQNYLKGLRSQTPLFPGQGEGGGGKRY